MREQTLLDAWETALAAPPGWRPAALAGALEALPWPELAAWTASRVNGRLLDLHAAIFGPTLEGVTRCPACATAVELALPVAALQAVEALPPPTGHPVPTLGRLWQALAAASDADARRLLLGDGADDIEAAWAAADPLAVTELALTCPACGHRWQEEADLGPFVWRQVDGWAEGLLDDVAHLARAYGWRESDVLALPPSRRRRYLERAWA